MIEGLKLALSHCTKYEDRMFLQFLIKVEMRNYVRIPDERFVRLMNNAQDTKDKLWLEVFKGYPQ